MVVIVDCNGQPADFGSAVQMFALLRQTMLSEYIGSEGVEGGQGDNDYNYGEIWTWMIGVVASVCDRKRVCV